ncbi:MAG: hypothetical protein P8X96_23570 [Desulfobacteraceae bacterium]
MGRELTHRKLKKEALALLRSVDFAAALERLCAHPPRQIVNPLFGLLYHDEPLVRWRAVSAMGAVVSRLAQKEIESARVIMRRFMWNLNDESGGIGWGSPESLGEIMARNRQLADEFGCLLVSYADPEGNFLEHPVLQRGVLWGWGRLARKRPEIFQPSAPLLIPYLSCMDYHLMGLAAWAAAPLRRDDLKDPVRQLADRTEEIVLYEDYQLKIRTVGQLAKETLALG